MDTDFWAVMRIVNMAILFGAFMLMIYKGIFSAITDLEFFNWPRFMNLVWATSTLYTIGEILFLTLPGGPRVFVQTAVALLQVWVVWRHFDDPMKIPKQV